MKVKIFFILFTLSCAVSLWFSLTDGGIFTWIAQKRKIAQLEIKVQKLQEEIRELREKIRLIKSGDRKFIEKLLRDEGWIKEGEKVIVIEEDEQAYFVQEETFYQEETF